jgi:hypothetical protein
MKVQRKLRLGAAAVIANGLIALSATAPNPALAAACSDNNHYNCDSCTATCPSVSGCTTNSYCAVEFFNCTFCYYT